MVSEKWVCGTSRIAGCRFSIYPMSGDFVSIIEDALKKTNTSKVWMLTDDVSTCVRGRMSHVFDVVHAIFAHAAASGEHVVFSGTFSIGCPGDSSGDVYMSEDDVRLNETPPGIDTAAQFALYPLNAPGYMGMIAGAVEAAKSLGTFSGSVHYASRLDGSANDVFRTLGQVFAKAADEVSHLVMTATLSCNSPSPKPARKLAGEAMAR
ncbi:YkoF family thiamine/hydroxymethylpyrimidine-binding protein [Paenibacillus sp. VCA1]|uniref:YkoF family thiamine/hydroxymethylpyrimidine-binding protein n=1 Tax=Paenibacillus sp. VCA1 TaxID=3039148 RepID=UPI00287142D3|nr:YkoF family thiamine/hydroxymethylpyrimidine-binding protein [Paenibacillus sp. VCA1]MDR9853257.1 YkoF family thiamine/hydroxymethylpyrimidine-binding protein [Paenibacillus sp. VCA1]